MSTTILRKSELDQIIPRRVSKLGNETNKLFTKTSSEISIEYKKSVDTKRTCVPTDKSILKKL